MAGDSGYVLSQWYVLIQLGGLIKFTMPQQVFPSQHQVASWLATVGAHNAHRFLGEGQPAEVSPQAQREEIFTEIVTSDHELEASKEGSK
jgi:hypothetical protein